VRVTPRPGDRALGTAGTKDLRNGMGGDAHGRAVCQQRAGRSPQAPSAGTIPAVDGDARVCPYCGRPPGPGIFCAACGRNLASVERLPTRSEWEAEHRPAAATGDAGSLADRCAAATAAFLAAMHAAGDPGRTSLPAPRPRGFGRTPKIEGWVVRPVDRDDDEVPRRYEPGLVLSVAGAFHRLDSELRGWGQRDFPQYHHTVSAEPIPMPVDERLADELAAVLRDHGVAADAGPTPANRPSESR
jgi:hypothetical protein